ncbi:MAG: LysR family transcriptional regulator [Pseudotabrizicola sp.]|uniref:LysR family transcriptional regulator n=1 Tax=Pseudotabrizicola sp. TaxID=2939647 RepID=UPI00271C993F|nr:LysR family transcriptional regulator [Pseudotabrizicola sp.]MDO9641015.1 LysR family transcriptional regulator [Pseudotabrizicola sp.]
MQNLNGLDLVSSFLVVAEELNFRRSADRLNLDQSALTRRIQKLEHHLGFKLLERSTREVALTAAGQSFYRDNAAMMDGYHNSVLAARRVAQGHTDGLRIGYMTFSAPRLMPELLARFHKAHPFVRLTTAYLRTQAQRLALAKNEIDAGFMIDRFDHPEFQSIEMSDEPLFAILPADHPLGGQDSVTPSDVASLPLVLGEMQEWDEYRWRLEGLFSAEGLVLTPQFEAAHTLAIGGMVGAGLGITIFPQSLVGLLGAGVVVRPIDHPLFRLRTALVWRSSNPSTELINFVDIVMASRKLEASR